MSTPIGAKLPDQAKGRGRFAKINPVVLGIAFSFGASISYGVGTVIARQAVSGSAPPMVAALMSLLFGLTTMLVFSAPHIAEDIKAPRKTYLNLAAAGGFAVMGIVFLYISLTMAPVAVVSPVSSLSPMFSLFFSHLFLQRLERVTVKVVAGTALVILGGYPLARQLRRVAPPS